MIFSFKAFILYVFIEFYYIGQISFNEFLKSSYAPDISVMTKVPFFNSISIFKSLLQASIFLFIAFLEFNLYFICISLLFPDGVNSILGFLSHVGLDNGTYC